jgi:hypothetical protein
MLIQLGSYGYYEWTFLTKEIVYICFHQTAFNISDMGYLISHVVNATVVYPQPLHRKLHNHHITALFTSSITETKLEHKYQT